MNINNVMMQDDIVENDIDEVEIVEFGVPRKVYSRSNHFENLDDRTFFKKFRLTKQSVEFVLDLIENELEYSIEINKCISPLHQLLTALRYYATGAHLDSIADFMGMHSTTAVRIIPRVNAAISRLYPRFVKPPLTNESQRTTKQEFYEIARFPNVIGALDCTHIKIQSPGGDDAEIFRNRKSYYSINVQGICNAQNEFINIVARWPGSTHDATIFNHSNMRAMFEEGRVFDNCILLGDGGYPLRTYLLTPLLNPTTRAEQLYNESHIRTRNKIECAFGILKRMFPVLAYGCRLKLENTLAVIISTIILYNIARSRNDPEPIIENNQQGELELLIGDGFIPEVPMNQRRINVDFDYRNQLINDYFSNL